MILLFGGKRGALFTLDAALGVVLIIIVLASASLYNANASHPSTSKQLQRVGYDVVDSLSRSGVLSLLDVATLNASLVNVTPAAYGIRVSMSGSFPGSPLVGNQFLPIDYNGSIVSGSVPVTFLYNNNRFFASVRFDVWPK